MTWNLFFEMFHVSIPIHLLFVVLAIASVLSVITYKKTNRFYSKYVFAIWLMVYIFIILYITVFSRLDNPFTEYHYHLIPLWSIDNIKLGYVETIYEKINNVILFVPLGILIGGLTSSINSPTCRLLFMSMVVGCLISICIEILQLLTKTGWCEIDDVICNTIGCVIGILFMKIVYVLCRLRS